MPHVSSQKIDKKIIDKIYYLFFSAVTSKRISRQDQKKFFDELLTDTEKVMLAKRLTAIAMLSRGHSPYRVSKTLKLSETTTNRLQVQLEAGKFKHILKTHAAQTKSALEHYIENLVSPLPKYGTSFTKHMKDTY